MIQCGHQGLCALCWQQPQLGNNPRVSRWMNGPRRCDYLYSGRLFSHRDKGILTLLTTWIDVEDAMLSEISQAEKRKKPYEYVEQKTNKNHQCHRKRDQICDYQRQEVGKEELEDSDQKLQTSAVR